MTRLKRKSKRSGKVLRKTYWPALQGMMERKKTQVKGPVGGTWSLARGSLRGEKGYGEETRASKGGGEGAGRRASVKGVKGFEGASETPARHGFN
ncbi:hypothetical protein EVAR_99332_1 [Eumeta japonica]|uniref:Uncharacterized protein n=1 Tax=Eumeta variegata TaxID=151549 RepID=A0A4C1ZD18_EUMVA|nr:hypothetical protein EVAR_99332_1 [Eumeta japonica]